MSYDLKNVVYEDGKFWILKTENHFEIYQTLTTHSRRRSIVGFLKDNYEENLNHAIEVLERLVKPSAHEIF